MGAPSASQCDELRSLGVDLFITGEVNEHHRDIFLESGIACIAGGHYNTETFGVQALQAACTKKGWDTVWLSYPNPV
jgi:putative NIF3 family GTP cyclohydrolase 1 type 2